MRIAAPIALLVATASVSAAAQTHAEHEFGSVTMIPPTVKAADKDRSEELPLEQMREGIESDHPSGMMLYAIRLYEERSDAEEGLFWFYASQLRWRTRMACHENLPNGESALLGSLISVAGPMFNQWAAGHVDIWLATVDRVHDWDIETEERFNEDKECQAEAADQRAGMLRLRQTILDNREALETAAAERAAISASEAQ